MKSNRPKVAIVSLLAILFSLGLFKHFVSTPKEVGELPWSAKEVQVSDSRDSFFGDGLRQIKAKIELDEVRGYADSIGLVGVYESGKTRKFDFLPGEEWWNPPGEPLYYELHPEDGYCAILGWKNGYLYFQSQQL